MKRFIDWLVSPSANENQISFFDVKELYDAAYAEKGKARASLARFQRLLEQAERLDAAYRAQLEAERQQRFYGKAA